MLKRSSRNRKAGKLGGVTYTLKLANGGLKIAYNPCYSLPADVKAAGDAAIKGIDSGTIRSSRSQDGEASECRMHGSEPVAMRTGT